jgi:hypothetical protein
MQKMSNNIDDFLKILYKADEEPSKDRSAYWMTYWTDKKYPKHNEFGGKWLIFCDKYNVDEYWAKLKKAQDDGNLGSVMKVSTAYGASSHKGRHVVCVYTYDSRVMDDVMRVREDLRSIGFDEPLNYKRDIETLNNVYGGDDEFMLTV